MAAALCEHQRGFTVARAVTSAAMAPSVMSPKDLPLFPVPSEKRVSPSLTVCTGLMLLAKPSCASTASEAITPRRRSAMKAEAIRMPSPKQCTLSPVKTVEVGSQVSGRIVELIRKVGAEVVGAVFLTELMALKGRSRLDVPMTTLLGYAGGFVGPILVGWVLEAVAGSTGCRVEPVDVDAGTGTGGVGGRWCGKGSRRGRRVRGRS